MSSIKELLALYKGRCRYKIKDAMPYKCGKCLNTERFYRAIIIRYEVDAEGSVLRDITDEFKNDSQEGVHCLECGSIEAVHFDGLAKPEEG